MRLYVKWRSRLKAAMLGTGLDEFTSCVARGTDLGEFILFGDM